MSLRQMLDRLEQDPAMKAKMDRDKELHDELASL